MNDDNIKQVETEAALRMEIKGLKEYVERLEDGIVKLALDD